MPAVKTSHNRKSLEDAVYSSALAQELNLTRNESKNLSGLVMELFTDMVAALKPGERMEFRGLGTFHCQTLKKRTARNPKTGESLQVGPKNVVRFKPGNTLKTRVAGKKKK